MKITTKRITTGHYSVFSNGIYCGTISKLSPKASDLIEYYNDDESTKLGKWASFDRNDNWLGSTHTKRGGLKWCFTDYR